MAPSHEYSVAQPIGAMLGTTAASAPRWAQDALSVHACLPRPPSLVFDIELEEGSKTGGGTEEDEQACIRELQRWLLPSSTGEVKFRHDIEQGLASARSQGTEVTQALATYLTRLGYFVHIRTALGGGEGCDCLRNLRNVFLSVQPPGAAQTTNRFLVDINFKAQWEIAKPTSRYSSILACLPDVYVAPEAAVAPLVNYLSQEMALAFRVTGVVLPPWRQTNSMLSKWLPRKSLDEQVWRNMSSPSVVALPASDGRRLHEQFGGAVAHPCGHWANKLARPHQKMMAQQPLQQRSKLQPLEEELGVMVPAVQQVPAKAQRPVKPITCEPKLKVVGGNFSSIGLP